MPVIWLVDAYRAGERGQVRALVDALAERLSATVEVKTLNYRKSVVMPHVLGLSSVRGITAESASDLCAPWPDVVVSCGVRNEPVCRWIVAQSKGRTRYIHVGRPWGSLNAFSLVVTTPQYRVDEHPNVLHNTLTLHSVTPERLAAARDQWQETFAHLPAPFFTVVCGGDSGPFTFGEQAASRLAQEASRMARAVGGSLLITTSSRTSAAATQALQTQVDAPHLFYPWRANDDNNPYLGMLACADELVVTGDSIAMLSEACATGRPVRIFDLGGMHGEAPAKKDFRLGGLLYAGLMKWLWQPLSRDITLVHEQLVQSGYAVWSDQALTSAVVPAQSDLQRTVDTIEKLLGEVG
ncbi:MAG: mitochondrial fission ELM1 family protein [Halioglobus sp.]